MAPSIEGEFARKRRMARRTWPTVFGSGLLSPRGYGPLYALMIFSHRILRYLVPFLHVLALATNIALLGRSLVYVVTLALQVALLRRRRAGTACASASAAGRAVLRGHQLGTRGRAVGLAARPALPGLGDGRGHAMTKRALDLLIAVPAVIVTAPLVAGALRR